MASALFIDGAYLMKAFYPNHIDLVKLRQLVERDAGEDLDEAYFFNADDDPPRQVKFTNFLQIPPPDGPGFKVKMYWLSRKQLFWPKALGGGPVAHPTEIDPKTGKHVQFELTTQKAVDVGLAYHLIRSHAKRNWNRLYLAAGDADFHEPIQALVEHENVHLVIIGSPTTVSPELRQNARGFIDVSSEPTLSQVKKN